MVSKIRRNSNRRRRSRKSNKVYVHQLVRKKNLRISKKTPKGRFELRSEPSSAKELRKLLPQKVTLRKKIWIPSQYVDFITYCYIGSIENGKKKWKYCGLIRKI
jgi:hypothetical protein